MLRIYIESNIKVRLNKVGWSEGLVVNDRVPMISWLTRQNTGAPKLLGLMGRFYLIINVLKQGECKKKSNVTEQSLNNPVLTANVGVFVSHVPSISSDPGVVVWTLLLQVHVILDKMMTRIFTRQMFLKQGPRRTMERKGATSEDGLDVHREEILEIMDMIIPSGSGLTELPDDLMNTLILTNNVSKMRPSFQTSQRRVTRVAWKWRRKVWITKLERSRIIYRV